MEAGPCIFCQSSGPCCRQSSNRQGRNEARGNMPLSRFGARPGRGMAHNRVAVLAFRPLCDLAGCWKEVFKPMKSPLRSPALADARFSLSPPPLLVVLAMARMAASRSSCPQRTSPILQIEAGGHIGMVAPGPVRGRGAQNWYRWARIINHPGLGCGDGRTGCESLRGPESAEGRHRANCTRAAVSGSRLAVGGYLLKKSRFPGRAVRLSRMEPMRGRYSHFRTSPTGRSGPPPSPWNRKAVFRPGPIPRTARTSRRPGREQCLPAGPGKTEPGDFRLTEHKAPVRRGSPSPGWQNTSRRSAAMAWFLLWDVTTGKRSKQLKVFRYAPTAWPGGAGTGNRPHWQSAVPKRYTLWDDPGGEQAKPGPRTWQQERTPSPASPFSPDGASAR